MEWRRPAAVTEGNDSLVTDGDGSAVARGGARGGRVRGGGMAASGRPGGQQQVNSTSTKHQAPSTKHQAPSTSSSCARPGRPAIRSAFSHEAADASATGQARA